MDATGLGRQFEVVRQELREKTLESERQRNGGIKPWNMSEQGTQKAIAFAEKKLLNFCPLIIRLSQLQPVDGQFTGGRTVVSEWERFQAAFNQPSSTFRKALSSTQRHSFHILNHWWLAAYCNKDFPAAARQELEGHDLTQVWHPGSSKAASAYQSLSGYHRACYNLFRFEFDPCIWADNSTLSLQSIRSLQAWRNHARSMAIAQRITYASAGMDRPAEGVDLSLPPPQSVQEVEWRSLTRKPETPTYLWDLKKKETVRYDKIKLENPQYICISHTWGRWKLNKPPIRVSGVPWKVPQNSRFDVSYLRFKLPNVKYHLSERYKDVRYVWIDLYCVPQGDTPGAAEEIARQAGIFRGSIYCIAWMPHVSSWVGVKAGVKWLSLFWSNKTNRYAPRNLSTVELVADSVNIELCAVSPQDDVTLDGWFTSLWTLQEAVLCPNLIICNYDWLPLADEQGRCISLRELLDLIEEVYRVCGHPEPDDIWPRAAGQLWLLYAKTKVHDIIRDCTASAIFVNTDARVYKRNNRAPAIMSALGVTAWYRDCLNRNASPDQNLVLGMFPLEFVREAQRKIGARLFITGLDSVCLDDDARKCLKEGQSMATMMPFAPARWYRQDCAGAGSESQEDDLFTGWDDPKTSTWIIQSDGSVEMGFVNVLTDIAAYPGQSHISRCVRGVGGAENPQVHEDHATGVSLQERRARIGGLDGDVFAVLVHENLEFQQGIYLYRLRHSPEAGSYMMKVGTFQSYRKYHVESYEVHWTVL